MPFFTPKKCKLFNLFAIEYDERRKIKILEPTAGIGNIVTGLVE